MKFNVCFVMYGFVLNEYYILMADICGPFG